MSVSVIMCEHPTEDLQDLISEQVDLVCVKADCTYPNRYACEICRSEHSHHDSFVRVNTICKLLQKERPFIEQQSEKANQSSTQIIQKLNKLLKTIDDLKQVIVEKLQEVSHQCQNNNYSQLHNLIETNEICNSKQQIQKIGQILRGITICSKSQLQLVVPPFEYKLTSFQQSIDKFFDNIRFHQISFNENKAIIPQQQNNSKTIQQQNSHLKPNFQFAKNMACSTLLVEDKQVNANQDISKQVALINYNLSQLQQPVSILIDFYQDPDGGQNENRIGLFLGKMENYNFQYDIKSFLVVGDNRSILFFSIKLESYIGVKRQDSTFRLNEGINKLKIEYDQQQKKLSINNMGNQISQTQSFNHIQLDVPFSDTCYFCFILAKGSTVKIIE